jgi:hypothetical protein
MREVLSRAAAGDDRATLARDTYLHRLRGAIAAMVAAMDGLDALVFTGGVGEHSPEIRSRAAGRLGFLGVHLDEARNAAHPDAEDYEITIAGAAVRTFVIAAREDKQIAAEVRTVLALLPYEVPTWPSLARWLVREVTPARGRRGPGQGQVPWCPEPVRGDGPRTPGGRW